jgi:hypothetical protein
MKDAANEISQVQCSHMFCLSVLQGNKETLAIQIGKELVKQKQK